jgi:hypothetical protein
LIDHLRFRALGKKSKVATPRGVEAGHEHGQLVLRRGATRLGVALTKGDWATVGPRWQTAGPHARGKEGQPGWTRSEGNEDLAHGHEKE